jgi:hypothetical protein
MGKYTTFTSVVAILAWLATGCHTTETITRRSELTGRHIGQITVLTKDSVRYVLDRYGLNDSTLGGTGIATRHSTREFFSGSIPLSDIQYIQGSQDAEFKTVVAVAAAGIVSYYALSALGGESHISATGVTTYHSPWGSGGGGGGSCPYIYSCNGTGRVLEAEAFGIAWGKGLEMSTLHVLPSLAENDGMLSVELTNERPETHYYNAVTLYAVEAAPNVTVVADPYHELWPLVHPQAPLRASDGAGDDVLESIARIDGNYWESNLPGTSSGREFEDVLEIELPRPPCASDGTIVIRAINTRIIDVVLAQLGRLVGDDQLEFINALEHDPEVIALLQDWTEEASLKVDLWEGGRWCPAGRILPEANTVPFTRGLRLSARSADGATVKVRLRALADVWRIDGVAVDWTPAKKLQTVVVPLVSAIGPDNADVSSLLAAPDDRYLVMFPGQSVSLTYSPVRPVSGGKVTYAIDVRGYLHEWMKATPPEPEVVPASFTGWGAKLLAIKSLLRSKGLLLPSLYAQWKEDRQDK